jgi:hypothetical protein
MLAAISPQWFFNASSRIGCQITLQVPSRQQNLTATPTSFNGEALIPLQTRVNLRQFGQIRFSVHLKFHIPADNP